MKKLILIKHAPPEVDPNVASEQWHLGQKGRDACQALARRLSDYAIARIVTSREPKAKETGEELAQILGVPISAADGLDEHDRRNVPHLRASEFISMMELFFRRPEERVLGNETAAEALDRITVAIEGVVKHSASDGVAVVTHGTVLALFLANHSAQKTAFQWWRTLGLPSFVVMEMPDYKIMQVTERL